MFERLVGHRGGNELRKWLLWLRKGRGFMLDWKRVMLNAEAKNLVLAGRHKGFETKVVGLARM